MSKIRLMRCDSAVSEIVGTVLMVGLVSVCFSIIYIQVIPQFQNYAEMLKLYPSVSCLQENTTLMFYMQSGLPVESWSLNIDGEEVDSGTGFAVGIPISYTLLHNSTHDVSLIENSGNGYSRMIYFARITTGQEPEVPPQEEPTQHDSLLHHYSFDNTLLDANVSGSYNFINHGTTFVPGYKNQSVFFSGSTYLDYPGILDLGTLGTVCFWFNATYGNWDQGVLSVSGTEYILTVGYYPATSKYQMYLYNGEQASSTQQPSSTFCGVWHHIAVTFNGSVIRFFLDGTEITDDGIAGTSSYRFYTLGRTGVFIHGCLDEMRIYNRDLTQAEIQTVMVS